MRDGIRNGSLGSPSGDHGEPVDAMNLEKLEVIKSPATLLYGSNVLGGVDGVYASLGCYDGKTCFNGLLQPRPELVRCGVAFNIRFI